MASQQVCEPSPTAPRRFGRRRVLLAGGLVLAIVLLLAGVWAWRANQRGRFPEPRPPGLRVVQEDLLAPLVANRSSDASTPVPQDPVPEPASADAVKLKARLTLDLREDFETRAVQLRAGASPDRCFAVEPAGLRMTVPQDSEADYCAAILRLALHGDFQITARYTILDLAPPKEGYGSGVGLYIEDTQGQRAAVVRRQHVREGHILQGIRGERREDGSYQYRNELRVTSSDVLSGWLRLVRVGSSIRCQIADPHDARFVQIYEAEFPPGEVSKVQFKAQTGRSRTALDAVCSYLDVQAEELVKTY